MVVNEYIFPQSFHDGAKAKTYLNGLCKSPYMKAAYIFINKDIFSPVLNFKMLLFYKCLHKDNKQYDE